ncbi:MAG: MFS transporter [Bacteroidetes bacterium]|nr:MAG: MFS transporter [Bacteroidota bacterium]
MSSKKLLTEIPAARWGVLILASFIMATNYYFYDLLAPIQDLVRINLGFSASDYGLVMSAYAFPNVFLAMAIIGGIILDRMGIRITGFSFIFLMGIGGALTAYAASATFLGGGFGYNFLNSFLTSYTPQLKLMIFGFFLFGLGAETSIVVLSKIIVKWFKGKEIALALGLNLAIGRLGAALAFTLSPRLVHPEWTTAIYFGVLLLWIGLLGFIIYMLIDTKVDRQVTIDLKDPEDEFKLSDLKDLVTNRSVIYITLLCVTFYSAVFPFLKFAPDLLMNKYSMPRQMAGDVTSYLFYGTMILTPLFGWFTDHRGRSASIMYLGSGLLIVAHLMFALTQIEPRIPIVLLGIAFSLVPAAMWPAVTKIVPTAKLGTAYGFMFSVQNIGLFVFPYLIGFVVDSSNPNYRAAVDADQFEIVQQDNMQYKGSYLDRKDRPIANREILVNTVIFEDIIGGGLVWNESHQVTTDEQGQFEIEIGNPETLLSADFSKLDKSLEYRAELTKTPKNEEEVVVYNNSFNSDENDVFVSLLPDNNEEMFEKTHRGIIRLYAPDGELVWEESTRFYVDPAGQFEIIMGQGRLAYADPVFFGITGKRFTAEVIKPLDYTNPMLVFSILGFFGLFFAFLLKRDDKTSGYGLELPNKVKE